MNQNEQSEPESNSLMSVQERLIVIGIISTQVAVVAPAVIATADIQAPYEAGSWQHWLMENRWFVPVFPFLTVGISGLIIYVLSRVLPASITRHYRWKSPPTPEREPILRDTSRPAILSGILAPIASAVLIVGASHVREDRRTRRPVVTWEGPLADYIQWVGYLGWGLSFAAVACGFFALGGCRSKFNWLGAVGMAIGFLNFLGSCLFFGVVYED